ncbi:MAG: radical SAM protein [Candidatus Omnitrophica bacterium]|nr:radical SAM protein [Candidatus Omnitrophota bacterium]
MRILLIDPPVGFREAGGEHGNFKQVLNKIPSLGLAYLAGSVRKAGHTVAIFDLTLRFRRDDFLRAVRDFAPQAVGITATTPTLPNAVYIASLAREAVPGVTVIGGGAHVTACPKDSLAAGAFDYLVIGEGEETLCELLGCLEQAGGRNLDEVAGIAFRRKDETVLTPPRRRIEGLDALPFPARDLLPPLTSYQPTPASYRKLPLAVIMTSRGCPSQCGFCDRAVFGEKFRQRSVDNVMGEIEEVVGRYGAREVRFFDDTFTLDPRFVEEICGRLAKFRPRLPWTCLTKVISVTPEILLMMRRAGCWQVLFGLESGDDFILERLGKCTTVEKNRTAVAWAKAAGLSVRADFLVGSPWETVETFGRTVAFAKSLPLDFAHFNKFVPYPGTAIYKELVARGYRFDFGRGSYINNHSDFVYVPEKIGKERYAMMLNRAYRDFYLRPGYLLARLLSIRTMDELCGHIKGAISIASL